MRSNTLPSPELSAKVADRVRAIGAKKAAAEFNTSRETVLRIAARLNVRHGSLAVVELASEARSVALATTDTNPPQPERAA